MKPVSSLAVRVALLIEIALCVQFLSLIWLQRHFGFPLGTILAGATIAITISGLIYYIQHILNQFERNEVKRNQFEQGNERQDAITQDPSLGLKVNAVLHDDDIADRKQADEALQSLAARLERSNQELQNFAFVASHDLKEPLRTIQNFGGLLRSRYSHVLDQQGQDYIDRMQRASKRMQVLIDDLLTLSRITTQAKPFILVDLNHIVATVLSTLELRIRETKAQIQVSDLPTLQADPEQMHQLIQNLISNALKYHGQKPPLIKIYSHSSTSLAAPISQSTQLSSVCQLFIEDQGIGFDEKYLDRIFKAFERLHGCNKYEGTGIGLAICRKIVERHHGNITATSKPGYGSTFIITLPLHSTY